MEQKTNLKVNENNELDITNNWQIYIFYFFIFSFLGWLLETTYSFIVLGHFVNRGFLYGPLCPIYGWGALILIIFLGKFKKKPLKLFIYSSIIFSAFEYYVSYILEALFREYWWDYSNDFMNLNGRISIFYTLAWGFIALIFIGYIFPFFEKKTNLVLSKIPERLKLIIPYILIIIWLIDTILSCISYIKF